ESDGLRRRERGGSERCGVRERGADHRVLVPPEPAALIGELHAAGPQEDSEHELNDLTLPSIAETRKAVLEVASRDSLAVPGALLDEVEDLLRDRSGDVGNVARSIPHHEAEPLVAIVEDLREATEVRGLQHLFGLGTL